MQFYVVKSP